MEQKLDDHAPDASTLWLAIAVGALSVLASFFLAIYFASANPATEAEALDTQTSEPQAVGKVTKADR